MLTYALVENIRNELIIVPTRKIFQLEKGKLVLWSESERGNDEDLYFKPSTGTHEAIEIVDLSDDKSELSKKFDKDSRRIKVLKSQSFEQDPDPRSGKKLQKSKAAAKRKMARGIAQEVLKDANAKYETLLPNTSDEDSETPSLDSSKLPNSPRQPLTKVPRTISPRNMSPSQSSPPSSPLPQSPPPSSQERSDVTTRVLNKNHTTVMDQTTKKMLDTLNKTLSDISNVVQKNREDISNMKTVSRRRSEHQRPPPLEINNGNVKLCGITMTYRNFLKAVNALDGRKRANLIIKELWTKEELCNMLTEPDSKYQNAKIISSGELSKINRLCDELQLWKELPYDPKYDWWVHIKKWLSELLKNYKFKAKDKRNN